MRRLLLRLVLVTLAPLLLVQAGLCVAWYYSSLAKEEKANLEAARVAAVMFEDYVNDVRRHETAIGEALAGLHPYTAAFRSHITPPLRWQRSDMMIGSSDIIQAPRT